MQPSCSSRSGRRAAAAVLAVAVLGVASGCATLSVDRERQLGYEFSREIQREVTFFNDPVVNDYINTLGQRAVAAAGPQPFDYKFHVVEDDEINAFAAPAGYIYVNTGTILAARNVSELMGVIAHEVGHVAERHIAENYNRQRNTGIAHQFLVLAAGLYGGRAAAAGADMVGGLGAMAYLNSFGRDAEREADAFAVAVMPRAGYDPKGLVTFFETLAQQGGANPPSFLSSHPATTERIENTRASIEETVYRPGLKLTDSGRLEIIQRRILLLTGRAEPRY